MICIARCNGELCVTGGREWFQFVPLQTRDEVPLLFREAHVQGQFRALHFPMKSYIISIFQLHNESINVWSHLLAFGLMSQRLWHFSSQLDYWNDTYTWPLVAGLMCGMMMYAFSATAHCIQSHSELTHYTAFMVDYAGIGLYGLGSVIVHINYCSEPEFYDLVHTWFTPAGTIIAFAICLCCSVAKVIYTRPYPFRRKIWQMAPVGAIYVLLVSPIFHRLYACFINGEDCNESIPYHVKQIFWFLLSGLFFASDWPQRIRPGLCDVFFHSHQLFHVAIMICTLYQMDGVFVDLQTRQDILQMRPPHTFWSAFGPVISVVTAEIFLIIGFHFYIKKYILGIKSKEQ